MTPEIEARIRARVCRGDRRSARDRDLADALREIERLRAAIHEAEERGALWALEADLIPWTCEEDTPEHRARLVARVCAEARKAGEHE